MGNLKNFATALVATAPSPATSGTSLIAEAGKGVRFPAVPFYATAHPKNEVPTLDNAEAVWVTGVSTDTFTIVREQKGTTAQTITTDFRISNTIFTEDMFNGSVVENEIPGGAINGSNTAFTIATAGKVTGTLKVYKNGVRMKAGAADFTETATGFTMVTAPATGTVLLADYRVGGTSDYSVGTNSIIVGEVPTGTVNGSNATFTAARAYIAGSVEVFINGIAQARTTHFTETTPASGIITMGDAPLTGDIITMNYQFNLNPASNADTVDGIHASATPVANQLYPVQSTTVDANGWRVFDFGTWKEYKKAVPVTPGNIGSGASILPSLGNAPVGVDLTSSDVFVVCSVNALSTNTNAYVFSQRLHITAGVGAAINMRFTNPYSATSNVGDIIISMTATEDLP